MLLGSTLNVAFLWIQSIQQLRARETTGRSLPDANDFDDTSSDSGSIGTGGWFNFEYYRHALPAQEMIEDGSIPDVEEDRGNLIVLNRYWLPSDWEIGSIIAVRMPDKTIEYKRILARFELRGRKSGPWYRRCRSSGSNRPWRNGY